MINKIIDNTDDEILGLVKNFIQDQKQKKKNMRLNRNFWKIYYKFRMNTNNYEYKINYKLNTIIGESFLKKYKKIIN